MKKMFMPKILLGGFSLAEALITMLIICLITIASIPVLTKKVRKKHDINTAKHGAFACYWVDGEEGKQSELKGYYFVDNAVKSGTIAYDKTEHRHGCEFTPPSDAKNFVVTLVGGGGGGAAGDFENGELSWIGETSDIFVTPIAGRYRILVMGAGGAGGHTIPEGVNADGIDGKPTATSGSPAGLIVSEPLQLTSGYKLKIDIGPQGYASSNNDRAGSPGSDAVVSSIGSTGYGFKLTAQGGGGGASIGDNGKKVSFYQCQNTGSPRAEANDVCHAPDGIYERVEMSKVVENSSEAHKYSRSGYPGGTGVYVGGLSGINYNDFKRYHEGQAVTLGSALFREYEKEGAFIYKLTSENKWKKGTSSTGWRELSQGRPYRNRNMTKELMEAFKIWDKEDQNHPFGSGGFGSGGGKSNTDTPQGNGGPGVVAIMWSTVYTGLGGKAGEVLQLPFAELPSKTLCFPGTGGRGSERYKLPDDEEGYYYTPAEQGDTSYIKNYSRVPGGWGADTVNKDNKNTYRVAVPPNNAPGGNGELAKIAPVARYYGGAGGFTPKEGDYGNGYMENNSMHGQTRPIFKDGKRISTFAELEGAGSGGGGGSSDGITKGNGAWGQSGIVFIQW